MAEDPDEMLHYAAFYLGLHLLLLIKDVLQKNKYNFKWNL